MTTAIPGRDTCNGSCETSAGCACTAGCAGPCKQGRLTCQGHPLPLPQPHGPVERAVTRLVLWLLVVLLMIAAVHTAVAAPVGSWDKPGENPFKGSRWHAVQSYTDMPLTTRIILGLRIQHSPPDTIMRISKTGVAAPGHEFITDMIGMHFGKRQRYDTVSRAGWPEKHVEFAAGWCFQEWCVGSPYVCNNIFAIMRRFDANTVQREAPQGAFREEVAVVGEPSTALLAMLAGIFIVGFRRELEE